jgi:heat shock protein HslJ
MKSLLFLICALVFLGIITAGCTTPAPVPTPTPTPTPLPTTIVTVATTAPLTDPALTGTWNLKGGMGGGTIPLMPTVPITITFNSDGTLSGFGGCNNYNANYVLTGQTTEFGKTISIGPIASTKMYCADTSNQETSYLNMLQNMKTYSINVNTMLTRSTAADQLSYERPST